MIYRNLGASLVTPKILLLAAAAGLWVIGCGGGGAGKGQGSGQGQGSGKMSPMDKGMMGGTKDSSGGQVAELGVGKGYEQWKKVNTRIYLSRTHGGRWVHTHVNDIGYEAYISGKPFPVGSVVVKPSWEGAGGKPSSVAGPVFVMEKKPKGYDSENEDWYYALYWPDPTPRWRERFGGGVYWQSPSKKIQYCVDCHENFDRYMGLPPREVRITKKADEGAE